MKIKTKNLVLLIIGAVLVIYCIVMVILIVRNKAVNVADEAVTEMATEEGTEEIPLAPKVEVPDYQQYINENTDYAALVSEYISKINSEPKIIKEIEDGGGKLYTYQFFNTDATFSVTVTTDGNVAVSQVRNSYGNNLPIVKFQYYVPENAKAIYKKLANAGYTGTYMTNYTNGNTIRLYDVNRQQMVTVNLAGGE